MKLDSDEELDDLVNAVTILPYKTLELFFYACITIFTMLIQKQASSSTDVLRLH